MALNVEWSNQFKKDYKKIAKRGYDLNKLKNVVKLLSEQESLPIVYQDHALLGNYQGYRECHIQSDWLLIYKIENERLILTLSRTGTHSDLF